MTKELLMRKREITPQGAGQPPNPSGWLDLTSIAVAELTSEDPAHPLEAALRAEPGLGWRAAAPGPQTIRLVFDQPQVLRRMRLVFQEEVYARTQEFALRWSADGGQSYREIVRQQYNFSPPGSTREVEEYQVELAGVTTLELQITPAIGGGPAPAALAQLQLA
jgi:hypothetical protein